MSGKYYDLVDGSLRVYPDKNSKLSKTGLGPLVDVEVWLADNRPHGSVEQADLREALYHKRTEGSFAVERWSNGAFTVTGRSSTILVDNNETRHLLLRVL